MECRLSVAFRRHTHILRHANVSWKEIRMPEMLDQEFERIGKRLFQEGLVGANFGNISVRGEGGFFITRTGAYLDAGGMPVFVPDTGDAPREASSEYRVHWVVYRETPHSTIVHAHPVHAVAASLDTDLIRPVDSEGGMLCPDIPVVTGDPGTDVIAENVAGALKNGHIVIVRGHGTFAAGKTLDEAYLYTSIADYACRILLLSGRLRGVL